VVHPEIAETSRLAGFVCTSAAQGGSPLIDLRPTLGLRYAGIDCLLRTIDEPVIRVYGDVLSIRQLPSPLIGVRIEGLAATDHDDAGGGEINVNQAETA
jgi:hypothetical protein